MNYSPDYSMRRRNQDCGCNRSSMPDNRPPEPGRGRPDSCGCGRPGGHRPPEQPSGDCGCGRPSGPRPPERPSGDCGCGRPGGPRPPERPSGNCGCDRPDGKPGGPPPPPPRPEPRRSPDTFPVGMAYVPWQVWQDLYDPDDAFPIGTIFRELDYPWEVGRCSRCR